MDMVATVTDPSGRTNYLDMVDEGINQYQMLFIGKEAGTHSVSIKHRGVHVMGSPFPYTVGNMAHSGAAHKVHAFGVGLERGYVKKPCAHEAFSLSLFDFHIWTWR